MSWGLKSSENGTYWAFFGYSIGLIGPLEQGQVQKMSAVNATLNIHWLVWNQTFAVSFVPCRLSYR